MGPLADHDAALRALIPVAVGATIALALASSIVARRILLDLPSDALDAACPELPRAHAVLRRISGVALVALGAALLVLPGPGLLFIAVGLVVCMPGWRRRLVRSVAMRPRVLGEINDFRRRHGRPALMAPTPRPS